MAKRVDRNIVLELRSNLPISRSSNFFQQNFEGKIQNTVNDNTGRLISISFTPNKQTFHVVTLYGPNKTYQREIFFQKLNNYINSSQNTIIGGDFNMVTDLRDRKGGTICNRHLVGSVTLINTQKLHDIGGK